MEKRKIAKPRRVGNNQHDKNGIHVKSGMDLCDCLDKKCAGCHEPCPKCQSGKCGQLCRIQRNMRYEQVDIEGTPIIIKHPARVKK